MGKCHICGKPESKAFLFMPSNVFVFLCDRHTVKRIEGDSSVPISKWCEEEKKRFEEFKTIVKYLDAVAEEENGKTKNSSL